MVEIGPGAVIEYPYDSPRLLTLDFDGTIARTSEKPEGGSDVNDAYARAIHDSLGHESAESFREKGGHNHCASLEPYESKS